MQIFLKPEVVPNVAVEFAMALGWVKAKWDAAGLGDFVITSMKDGQHEANSQHKQNELEEVPGEAADIRTWKHWDAKAEQHSPELIAFARMLQTVGLRVVVHPEWMPSLKVPPHLHIGLGQSIFKRLP